MGGAEQHGRIVPEDVLRAVAVMHVPVDDRDPLGPVNLLRMARRDRDRVEETEAHGLVLLGVMSRRTRCDKGIVGYTGKHVIDRSHRTTDGGKRCLQALGRGIGVRLELVDLAFLLRNLPHDAKQMGFRMGQKNGVFIGDLGFHPFQGREIGMLQRQIERAQPVRPLGMPGGVMCSRKTVFS